MKKALITGITGQDGSYLAELLLANGYEVHGLVRRVAFEDPQGRLGRIAHLVDDLKLHSGSLESFASLCNVVNKERFDECYHLAAQSFVAESFADGFSTMNVNVNGTHYLLEALRQFGADCRFYCAGSSEMFGKVADVPQVETTRFHPRSPYGISKCAGFELTRSYREAYGMFCSNGILFNHESPRRGLEFVTRKISSGVARIKLGLQDRLPLGNLEARRDWGHARDYVDAMHRTLQCETPGDFVVATGETHTVRRFCEIAFSHVGLNYKDHVEIDERFFRPAEAEALVGDASKAKRELGWKTEYTLETLVCEMVEADLERLRS